MQLVLSGSVHGVSTVQHIPFEVADDAVLDTMATFKEVLAEALKSKASTFKFLGNTLSTKKYRHGHRIMPLQEWFKTYQMDELQG